LQQNACAEWYDLAFAWARCGIIEELIVFGCELLVWRRMDSLTKTNGEVFSMANRSQLYKYKGNMCAACGLSVQGMVERFGTFDRMFEFNHVDPTKKHPHYDSLIRRELSSEQLDEVDKCVLLCRECHGVVHAQNITGEIVIEVRTAGISAEQKIKGQAIHDRLARTITFLTCDKLLIYPYRVQLGGTRPRIHFGTEFEPHGLVEYMKSVVKHNTMVIRDWKGVTMLRVEKSENAKMKIVHNIRFPFFTSELNADDGNILWIRNGIGLTRDGQIMDKGNITYYGAVFAEPCPPLTCSLSEPRRVCI
jgi:hypothetical protein